MKRVAFREWAPLACALLVAALAGCASKPDTRYLGSVDGQPLTIPAGLDTPAYSRAMEIPAARGSVERPDEALDIEKPPSLRATAGAMGAGSAQ